MESTQVRLTINPRKIAWLKFVLESYEGLALLRTLDAASGRVMLLVGRGSERETSELLAAIKQELGLVEGLSDELPVRTSKPAGQNHLDGKVGPHGQTMC